MSLPASFNNGAIRYAQSDGLSVSVEEIVPSGAQRYLSLAFDGAGRPAIAYSLTGSGALQLARFDGTLWNSSQVSSLSAGAVSLAFDPTGQPAIAYHETTGADLRFALFDGATWTDTAVAVTGTVGLSPSLAFDPVGRAAIAYFDRSAALFDKLDEEGVVAALRTFDEIYSRGPAGGAPLVELVGRLARARPGDRASVDLAQYRGTVAPWNDWVHVEARGRHWASRLAARVLRPSEGSSEC